MISSTQHRLQKISLTACARAEQSDTNKLYTTVTSLAERVVRHVVPFGAIANQRTAKPVCVNIHETKEVNDLVLLL